MRLSWIYAAFGHVGVVAALFFGLKVAVLAVVLRAVVRLGSRAPKNNLMRWFVAVAFLAILFADVPFPVIMFGTGLIGYIGGKTGSRRSILPADMARPATAMATTCSATNCPPIRGRACGIRLRRPVSG
jgi:chromate transport protein ChrA